MAIMNFDHESWAPPDKELRALRKDFFGPLTDELLRVSMAGEMEDKTQSNKPRQTLAQKAAIRSKERFRAAAQGVSLTSRVLGGLEEAASSKWADEKWFVAWQQKKCVYLEPPASSSGGIDEDEEEQYTQEEINIENGSSTESDDASQPSTPAVASRAFETAPVHGSHPGSPTERMMSRNLHVAPTSTVKRPQFGNQQREQDDALSRLAKGTVAMRLFCFPWEGGSAQIYEKLSLVVEHSCHVIGITYPGRLNRCKETPPSSSEGGYDLRSMAKQCARAMIAADLVGVEDNVPFCLLGHGMGALVAYEVAKVIRRECEKQPALFFVLQAAGPQSLSNDDFDEEEEEEENGAEIGGDGGGGNARKGKKRLSLSSVRSQDTFSLGQERNDDALFEHMVTVERGFLPAACVDQKALFKLTLPVFRSDCKALEAFKYESDWPFAKPFVVVSALFDGRLSQEQIRSWEKESTKAVEFVETCGGARSMLRDNAMVQELGRLVVTKVHAALRKPHDPEEEEMDRVARGLPPRGLE